MTTFEYILIFSLTSMIINTIGIYVMSKNTLWTLRHKEYFMCFAAGVLITSPLILVFPNALQNNEYAGIATLFGFIFMLINNRLISIKYAKKSLTFSITALIGIGIHSFVDGAIYTITFHANPLLGIISSLGLVAHEFAEGVITYSLLIDSGMTRRKSFLVSFVVAALTTPMGALIAYPLINSLSSRPLGLAMGFVSGVLIYLSASHLLPSVNHEGKKHSLIAFTLGVLLAFVFFFMK